MNVVHFWGMGASCHFVDLRRYYHYYCSRENVIIAG
jgi:hypothetical protein